jgi:chromosomal replication initiator protein
MGVQLGIDGEMRVPAATLQEPVVPRAGGRRGIDAPPVARFQPRMTFEEFVVGPSNQFVHAAAQAVASMPGRTYNPFFIYGGSGLGKTHLLNAIAHRVSGNNPRLQVCLLTAERFVNELIDHMQRNRWDAFRKRYRKVDLLLIDDIQFIAGKERTQEEFFHTFNALHAQHKQIVLTADCSPKEIKSLEERLKTRFEWGLMGDIQAPALETKVAILKKKAELEGMELPEDVALLLASRVHSNVRKLEGCLIKLAAFTSITGQQVDVSLAEQLLRDLLYEERRQLSMEAIQRAVADHYGLKVTDLKSKRRTESISTPRQVAMYLCRTLTSHSLPEIGKVFGGRDHTTVLHGCRKIAETKERDSGLGQTLRVLTGRLERGDS